MGSKINNGCSEATGAFLEGCAKLNSVELVQLAKAVHAELNARFPSAARNNHLCLLDVELISAINRLTSAGLSRDSSSGDPIQVMVARAELLGATKHLSHLLDNKTPLQVEMIS